MSLGFPGTSGNYASRSPGVAYNATFTWMGWWLFNALPGAGVWDSLFALSSTTQYYQVHLNGSNLAINQSDSNTDGSTTLSTATWYHIAMVKAGTGTNELSVVLNGVVEAQRTPTHLENVATNEYLGSYPFGGDNPNAILFAEKQWTAALTLDEIKAEMWTVVPQRMTNLRCWHPHFAGATERLRDYGSGGLNWTANGTLSDGVNAPISWGIYSPPQSIFVVATGGTAYNQSISGGITPSATLINQAQKVFVGSFTPTSSLIKHTQRALIGGVTPIGTLLNQSQKILSGTLTPAASLINQAQKILDGSITPVGTLLNQTQKVLSGNITPSGILTKAVLISLVGVLTPSGTLINQAQKVLGGTLTPLGQLLNQTQKVLSGSITPSGVLTATKTALISLVGSLTPSGILTKETQKVLSGTITPVGSILKQIGKILSGTLTPIGSLVASLVSSNLESTFKGMFRGMFRRMK